MHDFDSLTAEGPELGPVHVERRNLKAAKGDEYIVSVPRKGRLVVADLSDENVTVSLYNAGDDTFRKPSFRFEHIGASGLRIPAQLFLVSLSHGQDAPDLHIIQAMPGHLNALKYHRRDGWSAVIRCLSEDKSKPLSGAVTSLRTGSDAETERELVRAVSGRDGLSVLQGVTAPFATLSVSADGYLNKMTPGVAAGRGTFAFRQVRLERGGDVRAVVTVDARPLAGALCQLLSTRGKRREGEIIPKAEVFFETRLGKDGICATSRVARGEYILRVIPGDSDSSNDQLVTVLEKETSVVEIGLRRIEIHGTVTRGKRPEPKAFVLVGNEEDIASTPGSRTTPPQPLRAETDEDGHYRGLVWRKGTYDFFVRSGTNPTSSSGPSKIGVWVGDDGAEVDFQLNDSGISGIVLDQDGNPIAGAKVLLVIDRPSARVSSETRGSLTDEGGQFQHYFSGEGTVHLLASKKGYKSADQVDLTIAPDVSIPPITIALKRLDSFEGRVLSGSGIPVPGIIVATYQASENQRPIRLGDSVTDAAGHFIVPRAPGPSTRLFVSGSNCPLQILDVPGDAAEQAVTCADVSSGLEIGMKTTKGKAVQDEWVFLRWNRKVVPRQVLLSHLTLLGLPFATDGAGRLAVVGLPPGDYDVFLGSGASEATIIEGAKYGFLGSVHLDPFGLSELEALVQFN